MKKSQKYILWFKNIRIGDVRLVGGKNASLGEMFSQLSKKGISIPDGFVLTADAFWYYLKFNKIDGKLKEIFAKFEPESLESLKETGGAARELILDAEFPEDLKKEIVENYQELSKKYGEENTDVAARSSATAEDLPSASFAGQHETYLNIRGENQLLQALKKCMASLFTDRAISYREEKRFSHFKIALSVGVQKMIQTSSASSGVIFTIDTETGFSNVVLINSIFGAGEMIVKGKITPDQFYVFKPTLKKGYQSIIVKNLGRKTKKYISSEKGGLKEVNVSQEQQFKFSLNDKEILTLARWSLTIEKHYGIPQDIEWAKDEKTGQLFVVQSRPETVHAQKKEGTYEEYQIKTRKKPILTGFAVGNKIGAGKVKVISDVSKISQFQKGEVLVTQMTDPDWVPLMRLASGIVTDEGSKVCHAAIVSRELGIPCIVGTQSATKSLRTGQEITVDCSQGLKGNIFEGRIPFNIKKYDLKKIPKLKTKIMMNIGAPEIAFKASFLPNDGVGLARIEFILAEKIRVHPLALYHYEKLKNEEIKREIEKITIEHKDKKEFFIKELAEGIAQIAAAFYPKPVIVRLSDFKSNEYENLIGGRLFEKKEENPMLGFRGACRYLDKTFQPAFEMECQAIKRVRKVFGLKNIWLMVPFCRTPEEGEKILELMEKNGLVRRSLGEGGAKELSSYAKASADDDNFKIIVMCEIPSNVILAEKFLEIFDGMSIGSNDLTQLVLGIDRDNAKISYIGDERNEAVKLMIKKVIEICNRKKKYCGICGEAPSYFLDFAKFLIQEGIESISLNPDSVIKTILNLSKKNNPNLRTLSEFTKK